jgi:hypothetical protein
VKGIFTFMANVMFLALLALGILLLALSIRSEITGQQLLEARLLREQLELMKLGEGANHA